MEDPQFNQGFKKYVDSVHRNCYMFDVNKCCGYSEIVPTFKNSTCADLYRNIECQFDIKPENKIKVYATDSSNNAMVIQNDTTPIRNIILENQIFFRPIYPLPTSVVYKLTYEYENTGMNCCSSCNSNS
jgi:hypothetical protein